MARLVAAVALVLAGCGIEDGTTASWIPVVDQVYECSTDGTTVEVCWAGSEARLVEGLGVDECHPTPRHLGWCLYECPPPESGCNAFNSCWCPEEL